MKLIRSEAIEIIFKYWKKEKTILLKNMMMRTHKINRVKIVTDSLAIRGRKDRHRTIRFCSISK